MYSCGPPHMANQKQDGQLEHIYSSYVMIRDVTLKTCQMRWMIGRRGERGSGISVLVAWHDDKTEGTMAPHTAHLILMERSLFNQTRFFSLAKALEAFDIRVSSSASILLLLVTVEPWYFNLFTWVSIWPSICMSWPMSWDPERGW